MIPARQLDEKPSPGKLTSVERVKANPEVALTTGASIPSEWQLPLLEDENFFAAPRIEEAATQSIQATPQHETVRLLGFAETDSDDQGRRAIVKIGKTMYFMSEGDMRDGLELLEIQERSIKLQRGSERWSLALLDQPIVNPGVKTPSVSRGNASEKAFGYSTRGRAASSGSQSSNAAFWGDSNPLMPDLAMPEIPELPELPDLPDLGDLPELGDVP